MKPVRPSDPPGEKDARYLAGEIVWETITSDLPRLAAAVRAILAAQA